MDLNASFVSTRLKCDCCPISYLVSALVSDEEDNFWFFWFDRELDEEEDDEVEGDSED
jgi:hypothetical protein